MTEINVLYIGGHGRSGSTLLELILGQLDDFVAVGELRHIWDNSFVDNQLCSCGNHFKDCEFWQAVVGEAFGGYHNVPVDEIRAIKRAVDRIRYIPKLFVPWKTQTDKQLVSRYGQILNKLYRAIHKVSGGTTIVDASKDVSTAFFLATLPDINLHLLHLVRDSRAVGYSWQRKGKVFRPEISGEKSFMATHSPHSSAIEWVYRNAFLELLRLYVNNSFRVRYEDLVTDPLKTLSFILQALGQPRENFGFIKQKKVSLKSHHTVAGNPIRFRQGEITLHLDMEWQHKMRLKDKLLITLLTFPLLYHYNYELFPNYQGYETGDSLDKTASD